MTSSSPTQGDTFWTMLRRVTKGNNIIADSPYDQTVLVDRESVESRTPIEVPPQPVRSVSAINPHIEQAAFVEVISINSQVITQAVQMDEWPDKCPRTLRKKVGEINPESEEIDSLFENAPNENFENDPQERIEWDGTEQKVSDEARKNAFSEEDIRGSKNDLL